MATYLVTGGAGYVGSHACKLLAMRGHTPVVYDSLWRGHREAVKWGPLEVGDIRDVARLREAIRRWRPQAVLHFAAAADVGESVRDPALYYQMNVGGSLGLVEAMLAEGVDRLVFSSTCAVYGLPDGDVIREDAPQRPINPYGVTKMIVEAMLRDMAAAGLRAVAVRYFNAAGADPDGEIGERHDPEMHATPRAILAALGRAPHFSVMGDDYDTPDGTAVRDYVHVCDLARAHLAAVERLENASPGMEAFNLGSGAGVSVRELVAAVERIGGKPMPLINGPRRPGDAPRLVADPSLAAARLGWRTEMTLDDIVRTAWRWHAAQP
jgi:UDP-glucose-4-epimerase GalE